jgi:hypothetical protein
VMTKLDRNQPKDRTANIATLRDGVHNEYHSFFDASTVLTS